MRISTVRLKEPRTAQELYEKAMTAWLKQKPAEAQRWLEQALEVYPKFPEALTLYGGIQAALHKWTSAEQNLQAAI